MVKTSDFLSCAGHWGRGGCLGSRELTGPVLALSPSLSLPSSPPEWQHRPGHRQAAGLHLGGGHAEGRD